MVVVEATAEGCCGGRGKKRVLARVGGWEYEEEGFVNL